MSQAWVKAGQCGKETGIEARRSDFAHMAVEFVTSSEYIHKLAEGLKSLEVEDNLFPRRKVRLNL
jgi:hypothetical protein